MALAYIRNNPEKQIRNSFGLMCVWTQERVREVEPQILLYRIVVAALFCYRLQWLSGTLQKCGLG